MRRSISDLLALATVVATPLLGKQRIGKSGTSTDYAKSEQGLQHWRFWPTIGGMDEELWQEASSEVRWPDEDSGPLRLSVDWRLLDGRWEPVGLAIAFAVGATLRPLRASDLRGLRLPLVVEAAGARLRETLVDAAARAALAEKPVMTSAEYRKRLLAVRRREEALEAGRATTPGRPAIPLRELKEAARVYQKAFRLHQPPTQAVARELGVSHAAAAKRVSRCRELGLLGPAERGKASVGALMRRGDADSLARQIRGDEILAQRRSRMARSADDLPNEAAEKARESEDLAPEAAGQPGAAP